MTDYAAEKRKRAELKTTARMRAQFQKDAASMSDQELTDSEVLWKEALGNTPDRHVHQREWRAMKVEALRAELRKRDRLTGQTGKI